MLNLQATPLKKRILQIEYSHIDKIVESNTTENMITDQNIASNIQKTNIQFNPTKENEIDEEDLKVETISNILINIDICGNKETKHNDNEQNNLGSSNILSMKVNDIHVTPKKADYLLHNFDNINCNDKIHDNSVCNKKIHPFCLTNKTLSTEFIIQDLLKTPSSKKTEKLLQSNNIVPTNGNLEKIKNDCKQFYDIDQSELCNSENFNAFEAMDFLYNDDLLNTAINIEDTKTDILLSSMLDTNTSHINEGLTDLKEDPNLTDHLFISDHDKKDNIAFTDSDFEPPTLRRLGCLRAIKCKRKLNENYSDVKKKRHKLKAEKEHILKQLENIKEELPLSDIQHLASLRINLIHKVLPQHRIETTGVHATTKKEKNLFRKYGPLRKGLYTSTEDKIITQNWNMFCELHDWNPKNVKPFINCKMNNGKFYIRDIKKRQKFVQFLANGLPWRTLYSVYSRFKILYCNKITNTRYTSKEDKKILTYIRNKYLDSRSTKYTELAKLLKRTNKSVCKRYKYLKNLKGTQSKESKIKWTLPLIKKFIKMLLRITKSDDIEELKHIILPMPIWQEMEKKLNISGNVLKMFWQHQLHLQLFSTDPIYLNDIKIQLIEYMYNKGISSAREIIWSNVTQYFDGATAVFLCKTFFYLVQECDITNMNFSDIMEYLYHEKIPKLKNASTDKFLPRIIYKNGKINILNSENDTTNINTTDINGIDDTDNGSDYTDTDNGSDCTDTDNESD